MTTIFLNKQNDIEWEKEITERNEAEERGEMPDDDDTDNREPEHPAEDLGYAVEILRGERSA